MDVFHTGRQPRMKCFYGNDPTMLTTVCDGLEQGNRQLDMELVSIIDDSHSPAGADQ